MSNITGNNLSFRHWQDGKMTYSDRIGLDKFYNEFIFDTENIMSYVGYVDKLGRKIYHKDIIQFTTKLHGLVEYDEDLKDFYVQYMETIDTQENRKPIGKWIEEYMVEDNLPSQKYYNERMALINECF